ncbi:MAG: prenyltransferase, partial [Candidatus Nitrosomaritimum aestuariumsis]
LIVFGISLRIFPISAIIALIPIPLIIQVGLGLKKNYDQTDLLVPFMSKTLMFSRISGALFVFGLLIGIPF